MAPVGAWLAVTGRWSEPWWTLGGVAVAVATWVAGFDIFHALPDLAFDRRPARPGLDMPGNGGREDRVVALDPDIHQRFVRGRQSVLDVRLREDGPRRDDAAHRGRQQPQRGPAGAGRRRPCHGIRRRGRGLFPLGARSSRGAAIPARRIPPASSVRNTLHGVGFPLLGEVIKSRGEGA